MMNPKKTGFTLVEVMVAILLLVVLALGGAAVLYQTGGGIQVQGNKRVALELGNKRLETARVQFYYAIAPPLSGIDLEETYYLTEDPDQDDVLELNSTKIEETVIVDGINYVMDTEVVRWSSAQFSYFEPEHLEITVTVRYRAGSDNDVALTTLLIPPDLTVN